MKRWEAGAFPLILLCCIGATFNSPKTDGKYRVWIGSNLAVDWVDVCCHYENDGQLTFADYTPIEGISISHDADYTNYVIRKEDSVWELHGIEGKATSWSLKEISRQKTKETGTF